MTECDMVNPFEFCIIYFLCGPLKNLQNLYNKYFKNKNKTHRFDVMVNKRK